MLQRELIYLDVDLTTRFEVIRKMSEDVSDFGMITDVNTYVKAVLKREEEIPTAVGLNVGIPHGKSEAVKDPFITFMRTKNPFIWDERNMEKVQLIFMIGVPTDQTGTLHLKILAQISRNLMDETFRSSLLEVESIEDAYRLLKCIEENIYAEEKGR